MGNRPAPGSKFILSEYGHRKTGRQWPVGSIGHVADHEEDERYFGVVINDKESHGWQIDRWGTYFTPIKRKPTIII